MTPSVHLKTSMCTFGQDHDSLTYYLKETRAAFRQRVFLLQCRASILRDNRRFACYTYGERHHPIRHSQCCTTPLPCQFTKQEDSKAPKYAILGINLGIRALKKLCASARHSSLRCKECAHKEGDERGRASHNNHLTD